MLQLLIDGATLEVDNLNPSFLSRRCGFPNDSESFAFLLVVRCNDDHTVWVQFSSLLCTLRSSFLGFSIVSSKRIRQRRDSNCQSPEFIQVHNPTGPRCPANKGHLIIRLKIVRVSDLGLNKEHSTTRHSVSNQLVRYLDPHCTVLDGCNSFQIIYHFKNTTSNLTCLQSSSITSRPLTMSCKEKK